MKNYFLTLLMSVFIVNSLHAQEDVEEVVVTSSLTSSALSEIEDPLHVVDGDELDSLRRSKRKFEEVIKMNKEIDKMMDK